jgi:NDP-sugar pyrophosphorylase family protein
MAMHIVILAGGHASRLASYRTAVPKALMPIGDRSVLELMLRHAGRHGFTDVTLAVGDLAPLIRAMFGDGERLGLNLSYVAESEPLGSAGVLRPLALERPCLVVAGNVLTTLDLRRFYDTHVSSGNAITVATHRREVQTEFEVLDLASDGGGATIPVERYVERPSTSYVVSSGVYGVQPAVMRLIAEGEHLSLPSLVEQLISRGEPVGAYAHDGLSLDIRERDDYEQAVARYEEIATFAFEPAAREAA